MCVVKKLYKILLSYVFFNFFNWSVVQFKENS